MRLTSLRHSISTQWNPVNLDMFNVEPEGLMNLAVFELFLRLLRAKQIEIKGLKETSK